MTYRPETRLRVGRISALNMYPVYHHLERADHPGLVFTDGHPSELNRLLLAGALDVSAVSSIEWARNAEDLALMPAASITAHGAVDSIRLFSRVPFDEVRSVAVTPHSATSVALLRVLLGPGPPPFDTLRTSPGEALAAHDGVLLIGDEALEAKRDRVGTHTTDLAEVWGRRTGLPMVFGVWAARREVPAGARERLAALLRDALSGYRDDPEAVVRAAAERFPFPDEFIRGYFGRLRYGFGDDERAGLMAFCEEAHRAGLLAAAPAHADLTAA